MKDSLTTDGLDLQLISRYHHQTDKQFELICAASIKTEQEEIITEYGL